jgi:hypothetical protein
MEDMEPEQERQISLKIYESDHAWLKRRQLGVSDQRGEWVPLFDLVHDLITFVQAFEAAEGGA